MQFTTKLFRKEFLETPERLNIIIYYDIEMPNFKTLQERLDYENALAEETKDLSKKGKKSFQKCLNEVERRSAIHRRLQIKLEAKQKSDW